MKKRRGSAPSAGPLVTSAFRFAPILNSYVVQHGPPRMIVVPHASRFVGVEQVTVTGRLLKNQIARTDTKAGRRTFVLGRKGGRYIVRDDGALRFCLGTKQFQPHVSCEILDGAPSALVLNNAVGERIAVSGFLRCLFDEPGFKSTDDAHLFRICPVRAISIGGAILSFDSSCLLGTTPESWKAPDPDLNDRIDVQYWKGTDTLVFSNVAGRVQRCVQLSGIARDVKLNLNRNRAAWFTIDGPEVEQLLKVSCLQGTTAALQLRHLNAERISMVGLTCLDLDEALNDRYSVRLLALDIREAVLRSENRHESERIRRLWITDR